MKEGMSFKEALAVYEWSHKIKPDRNWRSVLYLATESNDGERILSLLDIENGEAYFEDFVETRQYQILSSGERMMVDLARSLFSNRCSVNLVDALNTLDEENWSVFLKAMEIYRHG